MSEFLEFQLNKRLDVVNANGTKRYNQSNNLDKNDPKNHVHILEKFRDMIGTSINVIIIKEKSFCCDDIFLKRFLYAAKFDCERAMDLLTKYFVFKDNHRLILHNINIFDACIQLALRDGNPAVLRSRDRKGRKVVVFSAANWDPCKYSLEDVFRAFLLTLDELLENVENQALGFVVIVDWTNFTMKQSSYLKPMILKLMIEALQECMPLKFKGIHFIAQPWYVDVALAVIKPFLRDKIKRRFIVHGTNLTSLHEVISKDILPPDLGGEGPSVNTLDWYHYLIETSQISESPKPYRLIAMQIYTKSPRQ